MLGFEDDDYGQQIGRITATIDGHTHIYRFPREESDFAVYTVKRHVEEGRLHPYAGLIICNMVRELEREP